MGRWWRRRHKHHQLYQLWLDDLYPRAKFADGLTIIEKLGHSKRMQIQRKSWIEAGKPKESVEDGGDVPASDDDVDHEAGGGALRPEGGHGGDILRAGSEGSEVSADPFEMDLDKVKDPQSGSISGTKRHDKQRDDAEPDEDELDALLAEESLPTTTAAAQTSIPSRPAQQRPPSPVEPSFDDDEEAMRDMDDMW